MGRYVPPDQEGTTSGNRLNRKRAPGTLKKDGTQNVRFELPYAVWCHTCKPHAIIGQGVRFNAEKRKIGYYHSTPMWQFRIKHAACGGYLEIKTDPKATAYVVVSGGKARDYGDEVREGEAGVPILSAEEREARREDAFATLEGRVQEKAVVEESKVRIEEVYMAQERDWSDTWRVNARLRDGFRRERKVRKREEEKSEGIKERFGMDIELLPENEEDGQRARLVEFRVAEKKKSGVEKDFMRARSGRILAIPTESSKSDTLRRQLIGNTRAAMDPFD